MRQERILPIPRKGIKKKKIREENMAKGMQKFWFDMKAKILVRCKDVVQQKVTEQVLVFDETDGVVSKIESFFLVLARHIRRVT